MRLLIDAHMIGEQEGGNESYMRSLLTGLARMMREDHLVVAASRPDLVAPLVVHGRGVSVMPVPAAPIRRLLLDLPGIATREHADVLCATYAAPPLLRCPQVVLIHDVSFARHPEWFSIRDRTVLTAGVGLSMCRSAAVVTPSEFSRQELAAVYPASRVPVYVVPAAAAPEFSAIPRDDDASVRARCGVHAPYILGVGSASPRKNLARLVEAFGHAVARRALPHTLVLTGCPVLGAPVATAISRLPPGTRVVTTGYVESRDLPALYRGADVFIYPSLYEGFGLPVLEAMASGVAVIASATSAVCEVAGHAARLVDPTSIEELTVALETLCTEPETRASLVVLGAVRARQFTWDCTAGQILDILRHSVGTV